MSVRNYALERYREPSSLPRSYSSRSSSHRNESYYSNDYTHDDYYSSSSRGYSDSRSYRTGDSQSEYYSSYRGGDTSYYSYDSRTHEEDPEVARTRHPPPSSQDEFFDCPSESEKLSSILRRSDVERHKHELAGEYFQVRKYALFVPTSTILLFIAISGFVVDADVVADGAKVGDSSTREFLVLFVASLAFLSLILVLLANVLQYDSKIRMHFGAAADLEALSDRIKLYRVERAMDREAEEEDEERAAQVYRKDHHNDDETATVATATDVPPRLGDVVGADANDPQLADAIAMQKQIIHKSKQQQRKMDQTNRALTHTLVQQKVAQVKREKETMKTVVEFYGYAVALQQISMGCKSDVPIAIAKYFDVMETRVELMSLTRTLGVAQQETTDDEPCSGRMRKNQIIRLCANEIYNEINGFWAWPVLAPSVDGAIERSLKRVGQLLNMNYRARKRCKILPCFSIPLCCKKRGSSNVFAIINEGIDQRELDMMHVERMALVKKEKETRARRMAAKPEEVLEMGGMGTNRRKTEDKPRRSKARQDLDPDGQTFAGMATERTASTYSRREPGKYPPRRSHPLEKEDVDQSQYSPSYANSGSYITNGSHVSGSYRSGSQGPEQGSRISIEDDISNLEDEQSYLYDESVVDDEKNKKKKKKKKKKHKKKKAKRQEEDYEDEYSVENEDSLGSIEEEEEDSHEFSEEEEEEYA